MKTNLEKGMDLCMEITTNEPYPDENLVSLRNTVEEQRIRLTILIETQMAESV